jgi:hypothetical protein
MKWIVAALLLTAAPAYADDEAFAKQLFRQASDAYAAKDWPKALELFRQTLTASPRPALLFNIAQCERQLGRVADAEKDYRAYLVEAQPPPPVRARVERLIAQMPTPPPAPAPPDPATAPREEPAPPPPALAARPELVQSAPAAPTDHGPRRRKWLPWVGAAAAVVVAGVVIGVAVGVTQHETTPTASTTLGTVQVNP